MRLKDACKKTAAAAAGLLFFCSCSKKEEVVIFATSRLEGRVGAAPEQELNGTRAGGLAVLKSLYDLEKKAKLALDSGNWLSETPEGRILGSQAVIECMNTLPYSAAAAGYRDLALDPRELAKLSKTAAFPLLASNLYLKNNKKPDFLHSSALLEAGTRKIGVFAITVSDPQKANQPKNLLNYRLEKESYEIEKALKALKAGGARITVMLLNINPKTQAKPGFYRKFLEKLPKTDLVITDEPTLEKPFKAGKSWVVPSGRGASCARISLYIEPVTGALAGIDFNMTLLSAEKYGEAPGANNVINRHLRASERYLARRIGFLSSELKLREEGRSPVGEFAADCMKRWARSNAALLVNSDLSAGLSSGPVTVGDLYKVMPYDTSVVFVKIRGSELAGALEERTLSDISASGLKIQEREGGIKSVETDFGPLSPGRVYHLAVPDSIVNNKNYPILPNAMEFANSRRFLREILGWCFSLRRHTPAGGGKSAPLLKSSGLRTANPEPPPAAAPAEGRAAGSANAPGTQVPNKE